MTNTMAWEAWYAAVAAEMRTRGVIVSARRVRVAWEIGWSVEACCDSIARRDADVAGGRAVRS